ncbi:MAG: hypothetical protein M1833_005282 [Piccolia ochrophora]|nr:MAG: hypothetical protein M1833_005282 [Piccolia ochrophora]
MSGVIKIRVVSICPYTKFRTNLFSDFRDEDGHEDEDEAAVDSSVDEELDEDPENYHRDYTSDPEETS